MAARIIVATSRSAAGPDAIWPLLARSASWRGWTPFTVAELERAGDPTPDGVGAIRRLGFPMMTSREEIVAFEPPHHLGYTLLSGLPLREYRSDVTLVPAGAAGTDIEWRSSFVPRWPGTEWFWAAFLKLMITQFSRRLARAAAG